MCSFRTGRRSARRSSHSPLQVSPGAASADALRAFCSVHIRSPEALPRASRGSPPVSSLRVARSFPRQYRFGHQFHQAGSRDIRCGAQNASVRATLPDLHRGVARMEWERRARSRPDWDGNPLRGRGAAVPGDLLVRPRLSSRWFSSREHRAKARLSILAMVAEHEAELVRRFAQEGHELS